MKKYYFLLCSFIISYPLIACPVCERANKKKLFGSFGHGIGPQSNWDYVWVWIMIIITVITLFYTIKYLVKPNESDKKHIKYSIF